MRGEPGAEVRTDKRARQNIHDHRKVRYDDIESYGLEPKDKGRNHRDQTDDEIDDTTGRVV